MDDEAAGDRFWITVTVTDEQRAVDLVDYADDVVDVRIEENADDGAPTHTRPAVVRVDLHDLTPKQWEALELAAERGYYDQPRSVDLDGLAAVLSISKSAVSQRLRAAEATIVENVLEGSATIVDE